jgi:hypothetical protein
MIRCIFYITKNIHHGIDGRKVAKKEHSFNERWFERTARKSKRQSKRQSKSNDYQKGWGMNTAHYAKHVGLNNGTMEDMINSMKGTALKYAGQGLAVLPVHTVVEGKCSCGNDDCKHPAKHPRIKNWGKAATTTSETIIRWWCKWPDANIGIATGGASGIFVVDVDGEAGAKTFQQLMQQHGWQPDTLTARTGRGKHYYFSCADWPVKTGVHCLGPGVDVRGDGGYVVAPPSRHFSGVQYGWEKGATTMAQAPPWMVEALHEVQTNPEPERETTDEPIPEGQRNDTLFRMGCALRGQSLKREEIEEHLMKTNEELCMPPLSANEIKSVAKQAAKYKPNLAVAPKARVKDNPLWWFRLDTNEWCANTNITLMEDYQVGWYAWLLVECWKGQGYLANDPKILAKLARASNPETFQKESSPVLACFELDEDENRIVLPRLKQLYEEKVALVEANRRAGQQGSATRKKTAVGGTKKAA